MPSENFKTYMYPSLNLGLLLLLCRNAEQKVYEKGKTQAHQPKFPDWKPLETKLKFNKQVLGQGLFITKASQNQIRKSRQIY